MTNDQGINELRRLAVGLADAVNRPEADAVALANDAIGEAYRVVVEMGGPTPPCLLAEIACQSGNAGLPALAARRLRGLV